MQGYGGGGGQPGGHPGLYPYMYASPSGPSNPMYGVPPAMSPYPIVSSHSSHSHFMSSPYGIPQGNLPSQPIVPTGGRMARPRRYTGRSKSREDRPIKPLKSAMKKSNSLSVPPSGQSQYREDQRLKISRSRSTQGHNMLFPGDEESEEIQMHRSRKERPTSSGGVLARIRTTSDPQRPRSRGNSSSRPRSRQKDQGYYTPGYLFVQISGNNRLTISSIVFPDLVQDIRERVITMWPEGALRTTYRDQTHEFDAHLSGSPWTSKGDLGLIAMRLILELFTLLARRGYVCSSAIDTGLSTGYPRLVFNATQEDPEAEFFMIVFSNNRRKLKLINHPIPLDQTLTELLRAQFPGRVTTASWDESDMYKIEFTRWNSESTSGLAMATILQHCTLEGFRLQCSIPLTHSGFFGMLQGRKELWIMRRIQQTLAFEQT